MCEDSAALHQPPVNSWHVESSSADVIQEFISVLCSSYLSPESYYLPSWARGASKKKEEKKGQVTISQCVSLLQNSLLWFFFFFCSKDQRSIVIMFRNFTNKLWLICCRSRHSATKDPNVFGGVTFHFVFVHLCTQTRKCRAAVQASLSCVYPWPVWCALNKLCYARLTTSRLQLHTWHACDWYRSLSMKAQNVVLFL